MEVSYESLCSFSFSSPCGGFSFPDPLDGNEQSSSMATPSCSFIGIYFSVRRGSLYCLWWIKSIRHTSNFLCPRFLRSAHFCSLVDEKYYGSGFRKELVANYCRRSNLSFLGYRSCFVVQLILPPLLPLLDRFELTPPFPLP